MDPLHRIPPIVALILKFSLILHFFFFFKSTWWMFSAFLAIASSFLSRRAPTHSCDSCTKFLSNVIEHFHPFPFLRPCNKLLILKMLQHESITSISQIFKFLIVFFETQISCQMCLFICKIVHRAFSAPSCNIHSIPNENDDYKMRSWVCAQDFFSMWEQIG